MQDQMFVVGDALKADLADLANQRLAAEGTPQNEEAQHYGPPVNEASVTHQAWMKTNETRLQGCREGYCQQPHSRSVGKNAETIPAVDKRQVTIEGSFGINGGLRIHYYGTLSSCGRPLYLRKLEIVQRLLRAKGRCREATNDRRVIGTVSETVSESRKKL